MTRFKAATFLAILLALSLLPACAENSSGDRITPATDDSAPSSCQPPQAASQPTPEKTVEKRYLKVTNIRSKAVGVIAQEPKYIVAAVPNIYSEGTKTALSGTVDGQPYRLQDLTDGQNFEIAGVSFQIAIFPERDRVTVCQLANAPGMTSTQPSP
jgi:hypothetical protein